MIHHLYIHYPVCAAICPYCSFYVHQSDALQQKMLVDSLCAELALAKKEFVFDLKTIYFGGGTPSVLSAELFSKLAAALPTNRAFEITIEVNPATVTDSKAAAWKKAGVNRVSLGAQSFDPLYLKLLGRQHKPGDISKTVAQLRSLGLMNINIDLMFALPSQPRQNWLVTLDATIACNPDHISAYALTYEEDTPFFEKLKSGDFSPNEENEIWMFEKTVEVLSAAGLPPYEISNFARLGKESAHNSAYWSSSDYLGIGPSAVSTVDNFRWKNVPDSKAYIQSISNGAVERVEKEEITPEIRRRERLLLGLRTREGISIDDISPHQYDQLCHAGLVTSSSDRLILSSMGRLKADSIVSFLF